MLYRARRNLALSRDGTHRIVKVGDLVDPAWVSEAGLARLLSRGYVVSEDDAPDIPVTVIRGIGPERAKNLSTMGIETLRALLAADPVEIERRMSSLSVKQIEDWQSQARVLLAREEPRISEIDDTDGEKIDGRKGCVRCGK